MRSTADSQPNIGRAEMEILRYISDHHPVSVREVADHVCASKGQVRTTALNVMERLREKGYLKRRKANGIFQYSPACPGRNCCAPSCANLSTAPWAVRSRLSSPTSRKKAN